MVQWTTFAGITGVVLVLLLVLSHLTQRAFSDGTDPDSRSDRHGGSESEAETNAPLSSNDPSAETGPPDTGPGPGGDVEDRLDSSESTDTDADARVGIDAPVEAEANDAHGNERRSHDRSRPHERSQGVDPESLSTGELLANVALSQGLFGSVLLGAVLYTGVPADALGVEFSAAYLRRGLLWGTACGLALYVGNEIGAATATRFGFDHDEELRGMLAPDSTRGWLVLLLAVLPLIALFEELLFRAALIGAIEAGFGVSPWLLAVVSSVAFALGHGMQGSVGIVVTGLLGFVLAGIFVVTESLLVVVVAHYLVNALEFAVHEGLDLEWARTLES